MRMSDSEYRSLQASIDARRGTRAGWNEHVAVCEDEGRLHEEILQDCRRRGWLAFHGSMAHRTHRTPGEPDFIVLVPGGQMLLVECKAKGRKMTPEQLGVLIWAEKLGHTVYTVKSFTEWLSILKDKEIS